MKSTLFKILFVLFSTVPVVTFALDANSGQGSVSWPDLKGFINLFFGIYNTLVPILIGLAFLIFFWGVAQFILHAADSKEHEAGRQYMIWGILALFILVTVWGIIQFMSNQLQFGNVSVTPQLP